MAKIAQLKDNNGNKVYPISKVYDTEEHLIGTWIDGKPLYRKVIKAELPECTSTGTYGTANRYKITDKLDFGCIEHETIYIDLGTKYKFDMPYIRTNEKILIYASIIDNYLVVSNNFKDWNFVDCIISVIYTKTTD